MIQYLYSLLILQLKVGDVLLNGNKGVNNLFQGSWNTSLISVYF
jgi:hypothetical protein